MKGEVHGDTRNESDRKRLMRWVEREPNNVPFLVFQDDRLSGFGFYTRNGSLYLSPLAAAHQRAFLESEGVDMDARIREVQERN
jgi:hypothetical protein